MKKIYFLASAICLANLATAQLSETMVAAKSVSTPAQTNIESNYNRAPGDVIGSVMNFTTPADWVINNSGTSGGGWVIGTAGPTGFFSGGMGAITSTSGGNFALYDADGTTGEAIITMANSVNLSTYGNVAFEFESYYRNFQGDAYFEISNNGTTWTTFPVHALLPLNESTDNPTVVSVNISGVAANQGTVWARFRYVSADDYAWMVDDVKFVEGYDDNLILDQTYLSAGAEVLDYYMVPVSQIQEFTFGAWVSNNGVNNQNGTTLNVKANDGTSNVYDQSSVPTIVNAFTSDSLEVSTIGWTPSGAGTYALTYYTSSLATDQAPADNTIVLEDITVGGNVYARDNGVVTGTVGYLGTTDVETVMGNYFEIVAPFTLGKIQIGVGSTSVVGGQIYGDVRLWDGSDFVTVETTPDYSLQSGDLGNVITLTLNNPVMCTAGQIYFVGGGHYGDNVRVQTAQIAEGAVIYNAGAASSQNSVFIVRMEEVFLGLDELASTTDLSAYPNPANNQVTVAYTISNAANVAITLTDITGKVVLTNNLGLQNEGNYSVNVNTSDLADGVYFYSLLVDGVATTKKLTIANN